MFALNVLRHSIGSAPARSIRLRRAVLSTVLMCGTLAVVVTRAAAADLADGPVVLPPVIYATPGVPVSIYIHDAVLAEPTDVLDFEATCDLGTVEPAVRWTAVPTESDVGDHACSIRLDGKAAASTVIRVVPVGAGAGDDVALLIVGDSLTHASQYPNEVARLLSRPNNPSWQMLGTHRPATVAERVAREGYGGWTWARFNTSYEPDNTQTGSRGNSPFLFADDSGSTPRLDVPRYIREKCAGRAHDYVVFMLGINDCFHVDLDDPVAIDDRIEEMLAEAEVLLAAFREAAPAADLGVCLTTAPNARDGAFEANYKGKYTRSGWRRIQQRLVRKQIERFIEREGEHVFIVPTSVCVDPVAGYPDNNAVHPNAAGYQQIAGSIFGWLKWRLAQR